MTNGLVSILIVAYNAEKYIKDTIVSCLNQTYEKTELLILDNNSSDKTIEIIRSMKDSRIKLFIGSENLGPFAGLNYLLDRAAGEYVAIQDHDDLWFPEKIKKQITLLSRNKDIIACGARTFYFYENFGLFILNNKKFLVDCYDHTSLFFRNMGFRYQYKHVLPDQHFQKVILSEKGKRVCLQEILAIHRIRDDGKNYSRYIFKFTLKNIRDLIEMNGVSVKNLFFFLTLVVNRIFPPSLSYRLAFRIFKSNLIQLTMEEFKMDYPDSNLFIR